VNRDSLAVVLAVMGQGGQENVAVVLQRGGMNDYQRLENWDVNRGSLAPFRSILNGGSGRRQMGEDLRPSEPKVLNLPRS
jgi:hypothetical protein